MNERNEKKKKMTPYQAAGWLFLIFKTKIIHTLDAVFARPNDAKDPVRSQRNPMAVSSPPYAFSLIRHTGTSALSKQRKRLCLVCFKVKAGWGVAGCETARVNLQCSRTVNNSRLSAEEAVMATRLSGSSLNGNSTGGGEQGKNKVV